MVYIAHLCRKCFKLESSDKSANVSCVELLMFYMSEIGM